MNKKMMMTLGLFILVGTTATAIVSLDNGTKIVSAEELSSLTNEQIKNYMQNNLELSRLVKSGDKLTAYYNITYLEPTDSSYVNAANETITNPYKVFTQEKEFGISSSLLDKCLNKTSQQNCRNYLVESDTHFYIIENVSSIIEVTRYNNVSNQRDVNVTDEFGNVTLITETYYELEPYQVNETVYEVTNTTITSAYLRAEFEQIKQFKRAIKFRDEAIGSVTEEFLNAKI